MHADSSVAAQNGQAAFNRGAQQEAGLGGMLPGLGSLAGGLGGGGMGGMPGGLSSGMGGMPGMTPPSGATAGD